MWEEIIKKQRKIIDTQLTKLARLNSAGKVSESTYHKEWLKFGKLHKKYVATIEKQLGLE